LAVAATASLASAGAAAGEGAGARAVELAASGLHGPAGLAVAFPAGIDPRRAAAELAAGPAPSVVGLTGAGAIGAGGAIEAGCSAIAFERSVEFGIGLATEAARDPRRASREATEAALLDLGDPGVLLLFLDPRSGDQSEAVAGAHEALATGIPIAGGAAGGTDPRQIVGGEAIGDAAVAIALRPPGPVGIGAAHGCRSQAGPSTVTRSEDRLLLELDGRPAATVYLEKLGFKGLELPGEAFERVAVTHPLAQPGPRAGPRIRHVLRREGDALVCATHIPPDAAVEFTREAPDDIIEASSAAVHEALGSMNGRSARAALLFDCAGRKLAVAPSLDEEVFTLTDAFTPSRPPLAGLYTHGEIARVRDAPGDLNHAVVVLAFG
jgi:hypothetical protein